MEDNYDYIAYIAIGVIIISLLGFLIPSFTGRVTDTGTVNVTVTATTTINFTTENINFGSGTVNAGQSFAVLYSENTTVVDGSWTSPNSNFTIENIGNTNVSLELATGKDAASFLGGTSPSYQYKVDQGEASSCTNTTMNLGEFYDVNTTSPGTTICNPLEYVDARDTITIAIKLVIPSDAAGGAQGDIFTATATAV